MYVSITVHRHISTFSNDPLSHISNFKESYSLYFRVLHPVARNIKL
jgi:hypothetical protein